jgi:hypothetical protein
MKLPRRFSPDVFKRPPSGEYELPRRFSPDVFKRPPSGEYELPRRFSPGLARQQDFGFSQILIRPDLYAELSLGGQSVLGEQFSAKASPREFRGPGLKRRGNSFSAKAESY